MRSLDDLTCPTTTFCLGTTAGGVVTTTDPGGGANAWTVTALRTGSPVHSPSCASAGFCAVLSGDEIFTSTNPTGGTDAWTATTIVNSLIGSLAPSAISCPSASLCVATTSAGSVISSTNPGGGASAWSSSSVEPAGLASIACPTITFCATAGDGHVVTSTNPAGGAGAWSAAAIPAVVSGVSDDIACPTQSLCLITGGHLLTSTDPTGGAGTWTDSAPARDQEAAVSCASTAFCAVIDGTNTLLTSATPADGFPAFSPTTLDEPVCMTAGTGCFADQLYVNDDAGTRVVDSASSTEHRPIDNLTLSGDSTTLTWTHDGQPRSLALQ